MKSSAKKLGISIWRAAILRLFQTQAKKVLPYYIQLAAQKPRDHTVTYCSGASGEPYTTMVTLLAYSIILNEQSIPKFRVGYDKEPPTHLAQFDFIELFQVEYEQEEWPEKALKFWNFVGKPQAMLGAKTELAVWLDSDIFVLKSLKSLFKTNAFIPTGDRVGGGIYCLEKTIKHDFYAEVLKKQKELDIRSDRPCMQSAIDHLAIKFDSLPNCDKEFMKFNELDPDDAARQTTTGRYWMHLSRGKTRNPFYLIIWVKHIYRLLTIK